MSALYFDKDDKIKLNRLLNTSNITHCTLVTILKIHKINILNHTSLIQDLADIIMSYLNDQILLNVVVKNVIGTNILTVHTGEYVFTIEKNTHEFAGCFFYVELGYISSKVCTYTNKTIYVKKSHSIKDHSIKTYVRQTIDIMDSEISADMHNNQQFTKFINGGFKISTLFNLFMRKYYKKRQYINIKPRCKKHVYNTCEYIKQQRFLIVEKLEQANAFTTNNIYVNTLLKIKDHRKFKHMIVVIKMFHDLLKNNNNGVIFK